MWSPITNTFLLPAVAGTVLAAVLTPFPSQPPIVIEDIRVVGETVFYTRTVEGDEAIVSPYSGTIVEDGSDGRVIRECSRTGQARYGPDEDQEQDFKFDVFFAAECRNALTPGAKYRPYAQVTPIGQAPSDKFGPAFVWQPQEVNE